MPDPTGLNPDEIGMRLKPNNYLMMKVVFLKKGGTHGNLLNIQGCGYLNVNDAMAGLMQHVLEKAYTRHEQFLRWRRENALKNSRVILTLIESSDLNQ